MRPATPATTRKSTLMVKKKSGRLEPFSSRKMARATSRAGVPYSMALEIAKAIKNDKSLAGKDSISSVRLRKMVAQQLRDRNQESVAKSYLGYKKTKSTKQKFERSRRGKSKASGKTTRTRAKQFAKTKDSTRGRPPRW
jgi:transcriptional repressor NrdR